MLKNTLKIITLLFIGIAFSSCESNERATKIHAEKLCNCMEETGFDTSLTASDLNDSKKMYEIERSAERILPKCTLATLKEIEAEMAEMNKAEKIEYTKAFLKNVIDTECADIILQNAPYDMLEIIIREAEREVDYAERRKNEGLVEAISESDTPD